MYQWHCQGKVGGGLAWSSTSSFHSHKDGRMFPSVVPVLPGDQAPFRDRYCCNSDAVFFLQRDHKIVEWSKCTERLFLRSFKHW